MRIFVPRDLDGFFGLFVDNLVQLLLIFGLCRAFCGMQGEHAHLLYKLVLPGAAVSILIGNLFYAWQAHRVARREGRDDVTALPYGINTPSLLVYVFFVMAPVFAQTNNAKLAWQMGLVACFGSGVIEFVGSFVAERVRRVTPRAALLSTLAGIAIGFISMTFALQIWTYPVVALPAMAIVLLTYFSGVRFPLGLPGGLIAIVVGSVIAWMLPTSTTGVSMSAAAVKDAWADHGFFGPVWCGKDLWAVLSEPKRWAPFLSVIIPMGLFNVIGSLQNIESAEAAGDKFDTRASLAANGIGTIAASLFGSCFPTTIYIGHPGWKGLGARAGYSTLNGLAVTAICLTGTVQLVASVVPIQAGIAIVLWIGIIITAQAFQATPKPHAPAVAIGLFPAIAAWGQVVVAGAFGAATGFATDLGPYRAAGGKTMQDVLTGNRLSELNGFLLHGLLAMEKGFIFTCMIIAALSACLIDGRFFAGAVWALVAACGTAVGLMHAYQLSGNNFDFLLLNITPAAEATVYRGYDLLAGYMILAGVLFAAGLYYRGSARSTERIEHF